MKKSFYQIYHNSRCSKSRKALELLKLRTESYKIIRYLEIGISGDTSDNDEIAAVSGIESVGYKAEKG